MMPWLARSHLEAPLPSQSRQPLPRHTTAQPTTTLWEASSLSLPPSSGLHRHRRHYSSVADDYNVARQVSQSFLSPRLSIQSDAVLEEDEEEEDEKEDDKERTVNSPPSPSPRYSVLSTASMSSATTTTTTSTLRRFWAPTLSRSPSPPSSPYSQSYSQSTSPTLTPGTSVSPSSAAPSSTATAATSVDSSTKVSALVLPRVPTRTSGHVVTYIPPLVDGAGGTVSRWQRASRHHVVPTSATAGQCNPAKTPNQYRPQAHEHQQQQAASAYGLLWSDVQWLARSTPELLSLAWTKSTTPIMSVLTPRVWAQPMAVPIDDVADAIEALVQGGLAVFELGMLAAAPLLFLFLPGGLFLSWLTICLLCVWLASWPLNGGSSGRTSTVYRGPWSSDTVDEDGAEDSEDDERWFYVCGMGATSRSLAKTGPRIAGVFGRPVTLIRPGRTYGAVADFLYVLLQRLVLPFCALPSREVDVLYAEIRHALVTGSSDSLDTHDQRRVVVLAHNTGATAVSQALARLYYDVPAARVAQLEIYTFGSLAPDFVLPSNARRDKANASKGGTELFERDAVPHIEHIVLSRDPCARFGVLRSVKEDLATRYCGGVFVLGGNSSSGNSSAGATGLGAGSGFRSVSRNRNFSPPMPPSLSQPGNKNRHYRMSVPFSHQQQQQYHHHSQYIRRSVSASSSLTNDGTSSTSSQSSTNTPPTIFSSFGSIFSSNSDRLFQRGILSMEDYLTALFGPEPWSMRPDMDGDGSLSSDAYFLDAAICVDRELAEKREMYAMAQIGNSSASSGNGDSKISTDEDLTKSTKNAYHRLSWTGLGATAKFGVAKGASIGAKRLADTDGLLGLEAVRRLCKDYDGRPGREVSMLAGYYSEAVVRHREQFGF